MTESFSNSQEKIKPIPTKQLLSDLMKDVSGVGGVIHKNFCDQYGFNPFPKKEYFQEKELLTNHVRKRFRGPQQWEKIPLKDKDKVEIPLFATKPILKEGILSDEEYEKVRENKGKMIEEVFGMFPKEIIKKYCSAVFVGNILPLNPGKPLAGAFDARQRNLYLHWLCKENTIYHELIHALLLHAGSNYYTKKWIELFGDGSPKGYSPIRGGSNRGNYAQYILSNGEVHGMTNAMEDMASLGECIFHKEGWKILRTQMFRGPLLQKKIDIIIEFLSRQTSGMLNKDYFQGIENGTIKDSNSAQEFFSKNKKSPS